MLDSQIDLDSCFGRQRRSRHGLDVEPESVLVFDRLQTLHAGPELVLGLEEVGPGQDDGSVELTFADLKTKKKVRNRTEENFHFVWRSYPEHSVAEHVAESLVDAEAVVVRVGRCRHEHILPGREPIARQSARHHRFGVCQRHGPTELVVEKPKRFGLKMNDIKLISS